MLENKNRLKLLQLKRRRVQVSKAKDILTSKRDALMKEFHGMVRYGHRIRRDLDRRIDKASKSLLIARGLEPHRALVTAALVAGKKTMVPVTVKNVWGVKIPGVEFSDSERELFERGSAPGYRNPIVDETAGNFELVNNALISSAVAENQIAVVGGAVRTANRRVKALEQWVIPEIDRGIRIIRSYLEENSREEIFRLKRFKKLKLQLIHR